MVGEAEVGEDPGQAVLEVDGARVIGSDGKVVASLGPPRLGVNWTGEDELIDMASSMFEGCAPPAEG